MPRQEDLPLRDIRVVEFSHMVMGPSAGLILADLGADVIKVEPIGGDKTRRLRGSGAGYFAMYNRNKRSVCVDLKSPRGQELARELLANADVLIENFRPGTMDRLELGYESLKTQLPRLIYCSTRGFLSGPYESRVALDEVAQMMGGLAYMTGPPGTPLRAGASVIDVSGGMFGVIGILAALEMRHRTGVGQLVQSSLFETTAFMVGQHIAQHAVTGSPAAPMPNRISAWAIYDVFETQDSEQVFVGVVSDAQWQTFCRGFGLDELVADEGLRSNGDRVAARHRIIPLVRQLFANLPASELMSRLESCGLPFAPIVRPEDLVDDAHLREAGGLIAVTLDDGGKAQLPALPLAMNRQRLGLHHDLPVSGQHTGEVLTELGYDARTIEYMRKLGVIATSEPAVLPEVRDMPTDGGRDPFV